MKKILALLVVILGIFVSCSNEKTEKTDSSAKEGSKKILVVYFSATGNTKRIAQIIASDKNADIFVYSDTPEESKPVCKKLGEEGYTIINLVEPFYTKKYRDAFYNPRDYDENPAEKDAAACSA